MKVNSFSRSLAVTLVMLGSAFADQASLDRLVQKEQANVDNEAVSVYGGRVGKLEAVFFIEFTGTGNPVAGYYYHPSRGKSQRYILKGRNPKEGVLLLEEYTSKSHGPPELSANCRLTKRVGKDRITWSGQMHNTDGRALEMSFSRRR